MSIVGQACSYIVVLFAGFAIGYLCGDNFAAIPKKTRKTRKPKTLSNEAIGETK